MTDSPIAFRRARRALFAAILALPAALPGQVNITETFTGTNAPGWEFGATSGSTTPYLTAGTSVGDTAGNGWLRLTESASNQATYALWDNAVFSVNAQIQIEMEYAFYNKGASTMGGGDGMAFFLVDAAQTGFQAGAYGGSLGYAPLDANENNQWDSADKTGMPGGYLGFGFDNWGNYGDSTEGRDGNFANPVMGHQNTISVRGPDDGDGNNSTGWGLIASSDPLNTLAGGGQMDFPDSVTRPDQSGSGYRSFRLTLDANNQLTVEMKFSATANYIVAFTADLSTFDRPEYFKIGFTASTGGAYEIHEVRNVKVNMTPWQPDSFEWSDAAAGSGDNWATGGNWVGGVVPSANADILFGDAPTTGSSQPVQLNSNRQVNSLTFDSAYDYSINGTNTITLGNTATAGLPSINVNDYNGANARHKINVPLSLAENLKINNYSFSTLCINGEIATNGKSITTTGYGATNLNGAITGSGDLIVNGSAIQGTGAGIVTISGPNTAWSGDVTVNGGQLVVLGNNALGLTGDAFAKNINQAATNGATTIRVANSGTIPVVGQEVTGSASIPAGTVITAVTVSGGNYILTLSNALTGGISNNTSLTYAYGNTTVNDGGTLTFRGGINTAEKLTIKGTGTTLGRGELAGAIYNDGGDNTLSGTIALGANSAVRSRDGNLTLSGVISGAYSLTKTGDGVVTLSGANTYSGATIVQGGALRVTSANAMNGSSNLQLNGGVLELAYGTTFTEGLGTGGTNLRFTGDGGFSASGGDRTVNIGNGSTLTWASTTNFLGNNQALLLSSAHADSTITLANEIRLNGAVREVRVADGSADVDAIITGRLRNENSDTTAGNGGLRKTGDGTLVLSRSSNAANSRNYYGGDTIIEGGALRFEGAGALSPVTQLQLAGGVAELGSTYSTYTASLGTADGNVRWAANKDGGFSAFGADTTVTLNNSTASIAWGAANFVDSGYALVLGSKSANATLIWDKGLDLAGATQTIRVVDGISTFTGAEGRISQAISNGSLNVTGNGRLDLTAANSFTGALTVTGSEVRIGGANGSLTGGTAGAGVTSITVKQGGSFSIDHTSSASNSPDRVRNDAAISLQGGSLNLYGRTGNNDTAETIGAVTLGSGANTINAGYGDNTGSATLTAASLTRNAGATVNFSNLTAAGVSGGTLGATGDNPRIVFSTAPTLDDGILAYATVNGTDFATHGANGIAAATYSTNNLAQGSWGTTTNYTGNSATAVDLSASRNLNSLRLVDGADINLGAHQLTVDSGGILTTGTGGTTISGTGLLTTGNSKELVVHAYNTGGTTISATVGGSGGLTKSGTGTLTLSGTTANTNTGTTTVNEGTLVLAKTGSTTSSPVNAVAGNLVVGDGRGKDVVQINANEQIADNATVTLKGGALGNSANVASLVFSDASGSVTESFHTLKIEGNTVLDFAGGNPCAPSFLYLDVLDIANDGLLTIKNWVEFTDFLLVDKTTATAEDLARIVFDGYGGAAAWKSYDSNYYQLVPYAPVPEPATFGLLSLGGLGSFALLRRRRRARG